MGIMGILRDLKIAKSVSAADNIIYNFTDICIANASKQDKEEDGGNITQIDCVNKEQQCTEI